MKRKFIFAVIMTVVLGFASFGEANGLAQSAPGEVRIIPLDELEEHGIELDLQSLVDNMNEWIAADAALRQEEASQAQRDRHRLNLAEILMLTPIVLIIFGVRHYMNRDKDGSNAP